LTIAFVMRAAANADATAPAEILDLKGGGMHSAYAYVKAKSKWVGPNMS
jgi:tyrosine-protein phosphatase